MKTTKKKTNLAVGIILVMTIFILMGGAVLFDQWLQKNIPKPEEPDSLCEKICVSNGGELYEVRTETYRNDICVCVSDGVFSTYTI
jgi:hypothetical protein